MIGILTSTLEKGLRFFFTLGTSLRRTSGTCQAKKLWCTKAGAAESSLWDTGNICGQGIISSICSSRDKKSFILPALRTAFSSKWDIVF
jgi:hypothetical protein